MDYLYNDGDEFIFRDNIRTMADDVPIYKNLIDVWATHLNKRNAQCLLGSATQLFFPTTPYVCTIRLI